MADKRSLFSRLPGLQSPIKWKRVVAWIIYTFIAIYLLLIFLGLIFNYLAYHFSK